jgi:hypothetical protein
MFSKRTAAMVAVCAALAACSDTPSRDITAPERGTMALDVAGTEMTLSQLLPPLADDNAVEPEDLSAQQAATGGRATGHVAVLFVSVADEKYSFNALSISQPPSLAAKGNVVAHVFLSSGTVVVWTGSVDCVGIVGNTARIAALWEGFRVGNTDLDMAIPPGQHLIWTVRDNGEGANDPPDQASEIFQTSAAGAASFCAVGSLPLQVSTEGNVQVRP